MNPIYVYGNGEVLSTTLHAISVLLYGHEDHLLSTYFQLTVSIVSLWMGLYIVFLKRWGYVLNWVFLIIAMNVILLVPTTRVTIIDVLDQKRPVTVDNVPMILASIASTTTTLGHGLTEAIEAYLTTPDSYQFHKTGSLFGSRLTKDMGHVHVENANFSRTLKSFINQCVIQASMAGITYNVRDIKESSNLWALLRAEAPQSISFSFFTLEGSEALTCQEGTRRIQDLWTPEINKIAGRLLPSSLNLGAGEGAVEGSLSQYVKSHFKTLESELGGSSLQGEELIRQEILMNEIRSVNQSLLSEFGSGSEFALAKAEREQHISGLTAGEIWSRTGVQLRNVLQIMMIASFLFLVPFLLFPKGWKFLIHYIQIMLSIELWAPLNAILNMVMYYNLQSQAVSLLGEEGLSLLTTTAYHNLHIGTIAWASWIQGFIPFISYGLVKAGTFALDGLSHSFTNASHGAALGAAREMVSGNYQLGNISIGNQSTHTQSGFQQMTSPTYNDGQFSSLMNDGGQRIVNPDGSVVFKAGANMTVSDLANSYALTDSIGQTLNQQYSESLTNTEAKAQEYADAQSQASREFADFTQRISQGTSTAEDLMRDISYGDQQSISKMKDISQSLQKQHGLSQDQSAVIAAGVYGGISVPTIIKGFIGIDGGAKVSGDVSSRGSVTNAINTAEDMAQRLQLSESMDHAVRSAQSTKQSEHQGDDHSYQTGLGGSIEQLHSARTSHQASQQQQDMLQKSVQDFENRSFSENQNLTQKLLGYTARQSTDSGQPMGMDRAYDILQQGGETAQPYVEGFVQDYAHMGHGLKTALPLNNPNSQMMSERYENSEKGIRKQFENKPSPLNEVTDIAQQQGFGLEGIEMNSNLSSDYQKLETQWKEEKKQRDSEMLGLQRQKLIDETVVKETGLFDAIHISSKGVIDSKIALHDPSKKKPVTTAILDKDLYIDSNGNLTDNTQTKSEPENDKNNH